MEKWRKDIEEILARSRTVDRWIIRDFAWREDDPAHKVTLAAMSHLMTAMRFLCIGPGAISPTELKERIKKSCVEAGLPVEAIDGFFALLEGQEPMKPDDRPGEATDEKTNEFPGDDA